MSGLIQIGTIKKGDNKMKLWQVIVAVVFFLLLLVIIVGGYWVLSNTHKSIVTEVNENYRAIDSTRTKLYDAERRIKEDISEVDGKIDTLARGLDDEISRRDSIRLESAKIDEKQTLILDKLASRVGLVDTVLDSLGQRVDSVEYSLDRVDSTVSRVDSVADANARHNEVDREALIRAAEIQSGDSARARQEREYESLLEDLEAEIEAEESKDDSIRKASPPPEYPWETDSTKVDTTKSGTRRRLPDPQDASASGL